MLNSKINQLRALPKGALIVLIIMSGAFFVGASLVYVGLSLPADGTVIDTPVETAGFSSTVSSFHFGSVGLLDESTPVAFTVTNIQPTSQTLHVYGMDYSDPEVTLVVTLADGVTPFSPTTLTAGASINLKAYIQTTAEATPGPFDLVVRID